MKNLNHQQIKQEELKLLQISGFSLGEYGKSDNRCKLFTDLPTCSNLKELERLKISRIKSAGLSLSANLNAFCFMLLHSIYRHEIKQDLLDIIKSSFYSPEMDLTTIKNCPISSLSNSQMKKLVVEFFYSLAYSDYEGKVDSKLCKFPIVLEVLVLFMRKILANFGIKNADNSLFKVPTIESYNTLIDYFDLNCRSPGSLFLFYEDHIFILETTSEQIMVGTYMENQTQKNSLRIIKDLGLSELQEQAQEDTEKEEDSKSSQNRSLQIRGNVSQSIVFSQHDASTPFFNFQQSNSSFSNSIQVNGSDRDIISRKQSLMRSSKDMSLLKMMDSKIQKQGGTFGNVSGYTNALKRTMLQNELKKEIDAKQSLQMAMDSPITLDSPHTLCFDGNFDSIGQQANDKVKGMKRSKSQSGSRMNKSIVEIPEQQINVNLKKKKKEKKKGKHQCQCTTQKKTKNKIISNLYEINMNYVPHQPNFQKKYIHQDVPQILNKSHGNLYVSSKGISCEIYAKNIQKSHRNPRHQLKYLGQSTMKSHPNLDKTSISCSVLPRAMNSFSMTPRAKTQSETLSKRQFSPISGSERQTSFSPLSNGSTPKITFSYINRPQKNCPEQSSDRGQNKKK